MSQYKIQFDFAFAIDELTDNDNLDVCQHMGTCLKTVDDYLIEYPEYKVSIYKTLAQQTRVFDQDILDTLPIELAPSYEHTVSGRNNKNPNNTLTHAQCPYCKRVYRNDLLKWNTNNLTNVGCQKCKKEYDRNRNIDNLPIQKRRRIKIWDYIAPKCYGCNESYNTKIMQMHHIEVKNRQVSLLVQSLAATPTIKNAKRLANEANKCIPLCPNCHAMVHHCGYELPKERPIYRARELLDIAESIIPETMASD